MKFILKCPKCQQEFEYKFFQRGSSEGTCSKCHTKYEIATKFTFWIFEVLLFYIYVNEIQPSLLPTASVSTILIGMVGFCGGITLVLFALLNKFLGAGFLFEVHTVKR
ncbi:MAG: hypothetical protein E7191_01145 [Erysipelotrichaceae bacterium]|nr:hypothetical protein [Erysipelotrichaceae bacterium]